MDRKNVTFFRKMSKYCIQFMIESRVVLDHSQSFMYNEPYVKC